MTSLFQALFYLESTNGHCLKGRTFFFSARKGFGSTKHCTTFMNPTYLCPGPNAQILCENFCFDWAFYGERISVPYHGSIWKGIDMSTKTSDMYTETLLLWPFMLLFMLVSCFLALFSACIFHNFGTSVSQDPQVAAEYRRKYHELRYCVQINRFVRQVYLPQIHSVLSWQDQYQPGITSRGAEHLSKAMLLPKVSICNK